MAPETEVRRGSGAVRGATPKFLCQQMNCGGARKGRKELLGKCQTWGQDRVKKAPLEEKE